MGRVERQGLGFCRRCQSSAKRLLRSSICFSIVSSLICCSMERHVGSFTSVCISCRSLAGLLLSRMTAVHQPVEIGSTSTHSVDCLLRWRDGLFWAGGAERIRIGERRVSRPCTGFSERFAGMAGIPGVISCSLAGNSGVISTLAAPLRRRDRQRLEGRRSDPTNGCRNGGTSEERFYSRRGALDRSRYGMLLSTHCVAAR